MIDPRSTMNSARWKGRGADERGPLVARVHLFKPLNTLTMGKGDKKTKKGKRTIGSRGKSRPSKRARVANAKKAGAKKVVKKAAKKAAPKKKAAAKKKK